MITLSALYALQGHIFLSYVRDSSHLRIPPSWLFLNTHTYESTPTTDNPLRYRCTSQMPPLRTNVSTSWLLRSTERTRTYCLSVRESFPLSMYIILFFTLTHNARTHRYTTHRQHHVENNKIMVCFGLGLKNVMRTARSKTPIRVRQLNGIILTRTRQNVDLCPRMRYKIFSSLSTSNSIRTYGTRRCVLGNEHVRSHHFRK